MASLEYPLQMSGVELASLSTKEQTPYISNDSEIGPTSLQKMSSNPPALFDVTFVYDELEFEAFEGWFEFVLDKGVGLFDINLPVGSGVKIHECNFVSGYSHRLNDRYIVVTAQLRALAKQFNTEAEFDDLFLLNLIFQDRQKFRQLLRLSDLTDTLPTAANYGTTR